mmetsp:Transcript_42518/g.104710  ORF Transcript_42518/g.104710 Transcript_42518/m.104710 type:complete len:225 (+) Transcript_42518:783-1457(+)
MDASCCGGGAWGWEGATRKRGKQSSRSTRGRDSGRWAGGWRIPLRRVPGGLLQARQPRVRSHLLQGVPQHLARCQLELPPLPARSAETGGRVCRAGSEHGHLEPGSEQVPAPCDRRARSGRTRAAHTGGTHRTLAAAGCDARAHAIAPRSNHIERRVLFKTRRAARKAAGRAVQMQMRPAVRLCAARAAAPGQSEPRAGLHRVPAVAAARLRLLSVRVEPSEHR